MMQPPDHLQEHIDTIVKHEQEFLARRTRTERLGDFIAAFIGSLSFVTVHLCLFSAWMLVNIVHVGPIPQFDPPPFSLLGTLVALEAILLASFILMRQSRLARRADERDHLMLQVLLLTEKEITAVVRMELQVARRVGLNEIAKDENIEQLSRNTSIDDMAQTIQENLSL